MCDEDCISKKEVLECLQAEDRWQELLNKLTSPSPPSTKRVSSLTSIVAALLYPKK